MKQHDNEKQLKKTLAKNHACYVLITCDEPTEDGQMQVEMTYEGDATVAAYLIQGAQSIIDEQSDERNNGLIPELEQVK
jgi:hypothetical protein